MYEKIKQMCEDRHITIPYLEGACGLGARSIYKWSANIPSVDKVKRVADFFGCTVDELLEGVELNDRV